MKIKIDDLINESLELAMRKMQRTNSFTQEMAEHRVPMELVYTTSDIVNEGANEGANDGVNDGVIIQGGYKNFITENIVNLPDIINAWESEYEGDNFTEMVHTELESILTELNYRDLRNNVDDFLRIRAKSKLTPGSKYIGIEGNVLHFVTDSHTKPGIKYDQHVKLLTLPELLQSKRGAMPLKDIVQKALFGDIEVHCTDPSWLYWGFKYIGTIKNYAIEPEPLFPKIRNPRLRGAVCKHLDNILYILPFQVQKIVADLMKSDDSTEN